MKRSTVPYSVPSKLEAELAHVRAYWEGLKRGEARMPFWDDLSLAALPDLSSAAAPARPRDIPGLFSRPGETAASGCCLGLSRGDSRFSLVAPPPRCGGVRF